MTTSSPVRIVGCNESGPSDPVRITNWQDIIIQLPVIDETALVYKTGTPANTLTFDVSALSSARVVTWPDAAITVAGLQVANVFTAGQTIDGSADVKQLIVQAAAAQTANIQEWQDSSGGVLVSIEAAGNLSIPTTSASSTKGLIVTNGTTKILNYQGFDFGSVSYAFFSTNRTYGVGGWSSTGWYGARSAASLQLENDALRFYQAAANVIVPSNVLSVKTGAVIWTKGGIAIGYNAETTPPVSGLAVNGNAGIGSTTPGARLHIDQSSATGAIPALLLDQADDSEEMIEFTATVGIGNAIEAVGAKTLTTTHFIRVSITGVGYVYIPVGTIA